MFSRLIIIAVISALTALAASLLLEKLFIPALMRIKMGQTILEIGPRWHKSKEGTPTMGGIFFIGAILISLLSQGIRLSIEYSDVKIWKIFCMMLGFGIIGFIDDFIKFVKKRNKGLGAMQKLLMQFAVAAAFLFVMRNDLTTSLALPFTSARLELGPFYWVFSLLFIAFMVNAVNLTDGIDGLASSVTFVVFIFFGAIALMTKNATQTVLYAAICGAMLGFLFYNFYPARVFMGDTGSLFLGGALVGAAYWMDNPLIIVIAGGWFLWEALSVVIQVLVFKITKKRVFKMSPFHHHMEMSGWKEPGIVICAVLITASLCALSYFAFIY